MATKDDVIRLHKQNPTWTSVLIAERLGCLPEYVRATATRQGLDLPKGRKGDPNSIYALGRRAKLIGLTAKDFDRMEQARSR